MPRQYLRILLLMCLPPALLLGGCGQMGPLYQPAPDAEIAVESDGR